MQEFNPEIRRALAEKQTQDAKIAQKVLAAHREAFRQKFPGQVEHLVRLTAERLYHCLAKSDGVDLANVSTWPATPDDILCLARSLESLHGIYQTMRDEV